MKQVKMNVGLFMILMGIVILMGMGQSVRAEDVSQGTAKTKMDSLIYMYDGKEVSGTISDQVYNGSEIKPSISVIDPAEPSKTLVAGTDYTVTYETNKNVTTDEKPGKIIFTAIEKAPEQSTTESSTQTGGSQTGGSQDAADTGYTGSAQLTFKIIPKDIADASVTVGKVSNRTYTGSKIIPGITVKDGSVLLLRKSMSASYDYRMFCSDNINAGTAVIKIVGYGNYTGTRYVNFTIDPKDIYNMTFSSISRKAYTGSPITPKITVTNKTTKTTLVKGTDYTVSYADNVNVGTAGVVITGMGNYTGARIVTFTIKPVATKLLTLKKGSKRIKVTWLKQSVQVSGYQIQFSTKRSFSSIAKTVNVGKSYGSRVVKKLKGKRTYYVRLRTYKSVAGLKYYSSWSNVKSIKTKK